MAATHWGLQDQNEDTTPNLYNDFANSLSNAELKYWDKKSPGLLSNLAKGMETGESDLSPELMSEILTRTSEGWSDQVLQSRDLNALQRVMSTPISKSHFEDLDKAEEEYDAKRNLRESEQQTFDMVALKNELRGTLGSSIDKRDLTDAEIELALTKRDYRLKAEKQQALKTELVGYQPYDEEEEGRLRDLWNQTFPKDPRVMKDLTYEEKEFLNILDYQGNMKSLKPDSYQNLKFTPESVKSIEESFNVTASPTMQNMAKEAYSTGDLDTLKWISKMSGNIAEGVTAVGEWANDNPIINGLAAAQKGAVKGATSVGATVEKGINAGLRGLGVPYQGTMQQELHADATRQADNFQQASEDQGMGLSATIGGFTGELTGQLFGTGSIMGMVPTVAAKAAPATKFAGEVARTAAQAGIFTGLTGGSALETAESTGLSIVLDSILRGSGHVGKVIADRTGVTDYLANTFRPGYTAAEKYFREVDEITPSELKTKQSAKDLGIKLTPGQVTGRKTQQQVEREIGDKLENVHRENVKTRDKIIDDFLNKTGNFVVDNDQKIVGIANQALKDYREEMQKRVAPLYKKAYDVKIDQKDMDELLKNNFIRKTFEDLANAQQRGAQEFKDKDLMAIYNKLNEDARNLKPDSLGRWDLIARLLWDEAEQAGTVGVKKNVVREEALAARKQILTLLKSRSKEFEEAVSLYREGSEGLNLIQNNMPLGKVAYIDQSKQLFKQVDKILFDTSQDASKYMAQMRDTVSKYDKDAWLSAVREHLESKIGAAKPELRGKAFTDKILNNQREFSHLREALNFKGNEAMLEKLDKMQDVFTKMGYTAVNETADRVQQSYLKNINSGAVGDALFKLLLSDTWDKTFMDIAKMKNKAEQRIQLNRLLTVIGADTATEQLNKEENQ